MKGGAARFQVNLEFSMINEQHTLSNGDYKNTILNQTSANFDTFSTRRNTFKELLYSYMPPAYKNRSEIISVNLIGTGDSGLPDYPISMNQYLEQEAMESYNFISPKTEDYIDLKIKIILKPKKQQKTKTMGSKKKKKKKEKKEKKEKKISKKIKKNKYKTKKKDNKKINK